MSPRRIVLVSGSPSKTSRSTRLLEEVGAHLAKRGFENRHFSAGSFEPQELLNPTTETPNIRELVSAARSAVAIVVATPVYKATFSGILKVILDLIPHDALTGGVGLGIATGRIAEQLPDTALALSGIFRFFKLSSVVRALTFTDEELKAEPSASLPAGVEQVVAARTQELIEAVKAR